MNLVDFSHCVSIHRQSCYQDSLYSSNVTFMCDISGDCKADVMKIHTKNS